VALTKLAITSATSKAAERTQKMCNQYNYRYFYPRWLQKLFQALAKSGDDEFEIAPCPRQVAGLPPASVTRSKSPSQTTAIAKIPILPNRSASSALPNTAFICHYASRGSYFSAIKVMISGWRAIAQLIVVLCHPAPITSPVGTDTQPVDFH